MNGAVSRFRGKATLIGAVLVALYTVLISSADGITKLIAGGYSAPQLYCLSGLIVVGLSWAADRHPSQRRGLRTANPRAMAIRSLATVVATGAESVVDSTPSDERVTKI